MNVIFVHGWSDQPKSMVRVAEGLRSAGLTGVNEYYFGYRSRDDEATIADYAEGLHIWLKKHQLLDPSDEKVRGDKNLAIRRNLHFITHSTGALVVRQWMMQYAWVRAADRVATICFLAPANFGSPLAHKGKSFLGKLSKGIRELRDFGETGRRTLEALELASPAQWRLADFDLFGANGTIYGKNGVRASVITGASGYGGLRAFVNEDGTDGTIVVSGAGLSCRKFSVDFASGRRYADWIKPRGGQPDVPLLVLSEPNHSSILDLGDNPLLAKYVKDTLRSTAKTYDNLFKQFRDETTRQVREVDTKDGRRERYQQFVFHLLDDRWDPIPDYFIEFGAWQRDRIDANARYPTPTRLPSGKLPKRRKGEIKTSEKIGEHFRMNGRAHSVDSSFRRFLMSPAEIDRLLGDEYVLTLQVAADSGDEDIVYDTARFDSVQVYDPKKTGVISWVFPDTTTLIEMKVDRYTRRITRLIKGRLA